MVIRRQVANAAPTQSRTHSQDHFAAALGTLPHNGRKLQRADNTDSAMITVSRAFVILAVCLQDAQ
jgi:hypothetical protein